MNDQSPDPAGPPLPDPQTVQRSLHWSERWREKAPEGSWLRERLDSVFLPIEPPTSFTEDHKELVERLMPRDANREPDEDRAKEILEEAQAIYETAEARGQGAERRATTLQGAVAIAASLLLAGGALLADPTKVRGDGWRVAFAVGLIAVTFCLVAAGARALASTSRIHVYHSPTPTDILRRSGLPAAEARIELAAETLKDYGFNTKVAAWKVAHLRAAAEWFSRALLALMALAILVAAYGVFGPDPRQQPEERQGAQSARPLSPPCVAGKGAGSAVEARLSARRALSVPPRWHVRG